MTRTTREDTAARETIEIKQRLDQIEHRLTVMSNEGTVAIAYRGVAQSLAAAGWTKIGLDTVGNGDPLKRFDLTNRWYVVPSDGFYAVSGGIAAIIGPKAVFITSVWVNEGEVVRGDRTQNNNANAELLNTMAAGIILCKLGDHIELRGYNSGAEAGMEISPVENRLNVVRVANPSG